MANPSLAMIPSGYKAGKLYSVLPQDGTGDFTVVRNSVATRVNENGVIEEVAANVPRLDYSDGGCPVLLCEPQSTNLALWSQDFSNAVWIKSASSVLLNQIISPNGEKVATKLIPDATTTQNHYINQVITIASGVEYTNSFYAKKGEYDFTSVYASNFGGFVATWDLNLGVVVLGDAEIEDAGNGWYKCSYTAISTSTSHSYRIYANETSDRNASFTGDGIKGIYIWGAQIEQLSYPTSYIKTEGTTVTRVADVVTDAGDVNTFNSEEGTLFFETAALTAGGTYSYISITDGNITGQRIVFRYDTVADKIVIYQYVGTGVSAELTHTLSDVTVFNKIAWRWKLNDFSLWVNGIKISTDTNGAVNSPNTLNTLNFSQVSPFYGKVKQLKVFKRALTDTELTTLTTL